MNFNAEEPDAIVYTRDQGVMRQLDALVTEYPDIFKCIGEADIDKTYSMPKSRISYRKPRRISEAKRQQAREAIKKINKVDNCIAFVPRKQYNDSWRFGVWIKIIKHIQ